MLDQKGEDVELADVPCIHGVGVELVHVENVGRVRDVLQPVLHHTEHLVRTFEGRFHGGGVVVIALELRDRNHAQRRRRHDIFVRIHQQLLDRVGGEVVARHVVEALCARVRPAQLDAERLPPPERNLGLRRDIPRGLRPALVRGHDLHRLPGEHLFELGDRHRDIGVLCKDRPGDGERHERQVREADRAHCVFQDGYASGETIPANRREPIFWGSARNHSRR